MSRRGSRAALPLLILLAWAPEARAHDSVKAIIIMTPGIPRANEACALEVSVLAPPGLPLLDQIQGVRIVGTMTSHNMTPIEVPLARTSEAGGYWGQVALTMGGPWQLTIRIMVDDEEMTGDFPVQAVGPRDQGDAVGMRYIVEMRDPLRANLLPPWWVVGGTLGLVAIIEITAVLLNIGRNRRAARAAA